jgi:hypothetical protein
LKDWDNVLKEFESERLSDGEWLFRGVHNSTWLLQTSLERHAPPGSKRSDAENTLLREFKKRAHIYLPPQAIPGANETGEWLALMQHFGAPTRLLDVTRSPYLALYFAIEDISRVGSSSVWAINKSWCLRAAGRVALKIRPDGRDEIERWLDGVEAGNYFDVEVPDELFEEGYPEPVPYAKGCLLSQLRGDDWRRSEMTLVIPYVPNKLTQRLSIQQGEFLVPLNANTSFSDNLEALGDFGDNVLQFTVPYAQRGRILERLRLMNITREQLFPGMDGFAQSFQQFLFRESHLERFRRQMAEVLRRQRQSLRLRRKAAKGKTR